MRRKDIVDYHHEPVLHKQRTGMFAGVRRYKLEEVLDPQEVSGGWEQTLVFASEIAGGAQHRMTLRAKRKDGLEKHRSRIAAMLESEATALRQYRDGDVTHADFNREMGMRIRETLRGEGISDLPEREWRWESNQLIFRGQQKLF
ncbi:MAG: hypothetical protein ACOY3M_01955 [Patescibacteria group bacterium]